MEANEVKTRLNGIFRNTFSDDNIEIHENMTANDVPQWDSLSHFDLILAVEKSFGIRLKTREVHSMKNVGDFIELIRTKAV
jgi:acyl carrier protein